MNIVILFYIFYIIIPFYLFAYFIYKLARRFINFQKLINKTNDEPLLKELNKLPQLIRTNPHEAMTSLGKISDWNNNLVINSSSLRLIRKVLSATRGSFSNSETSFVSSSKFTIDLADLLEITLEALNSQDKAAQYLSLSDIVRLSTVTNKSKTEIIEYKDKATIEPDENLIRKLYIISNLLSVSSKEYELNQQIELFRDAKTWMSVSSDKSLVLHYLSIRINGLRLEHPFTPSKEYAKLFQERGKISKLINIVADSLNNKEYGKVMEIIENDFERYSKTNIQKKHQNSYEQ